MPVGGREEGTRTTTTVASCTTVPDRPPEGTEGVESVGPSDVPADLSRDKMRGSSYVGGGGGDGLERV